MIKVSSTQSVVSAIPKQSFGTRKRKWWVAARFGGFRYRSTHPTLAFFTDLRLHGFSLIFGFI